MTDVTYRNGELVNARPNWGAIWAGMFTFIGIWSVFGLLGTAIFAGVANSGPNTGVGMSVGLGVWSIVLTVIAMYVGGRVTGHFASINDSRDGVLHGLIMFGLSVVAVVVLSVTGAALASRPAVGNATNNYMLNMFADVGWIGFLSLFFGWLAAMGGAATGTHVAVSRPSGAVEHLHHAA